MAKTWLVLDCPFLAWRAAHVYGELSHNGDPTGVAYGFLQALQKLQREFQTRDVIFAFDVGHSLRKQAFPGYKAHRDKGGNGVETAAAARDAVRKQVKQIRMAILPELGYKNLFWQWGYEADDVIASFCLYSLPKGDKAVIVSADQDLYQLIAPNVVCCNPKSNGKIRIMDLNAFALEYGITPTAWVTVKAMAGCTSDNVPGIKGVGVKTACKHIRQLLKPGRTKDSILAAQEIIARNCELVKLPYKGCQQFEIQKDEVTHKKWRGVLERLGIKSLGYEEL